MSKENMKDNFMGAMTDGTNILIDVLALRYEGVFVLQSKEIHPQGFQFLLVSATNGNLLDT